MQGDLIEARKEPKDQTSLSKDYTKFNFFLKKDLAKKATPVLITHVLRGEEAAALRMIEISPELLLTQGSANDYSSRCYIDITAFQAALLSHDKWMWQKMLPLFEKIKIEGFNAEQEIARQFNKIFPQGIPEQGAYDFDALVEVIENSSETNVLKELYTFALMPFRKNFNNIQAALNEEATLSKALMTFREKFTEQSIKEKFFNHQHLIRLFTIYLNKYKKWSSTKLELLWSQVIGFTERFLPACYAQVFCQGLYYVMQKNQLVDRSLMIRPEIAYFPLSSNDGLGYDFGIYGGLYGGEAVKYGGDFWGGEAFRQFEKLCGENRAELLSLQHRLAIEDQSLGVNSGIKKLPLADRYSCSNFI